MPLVLSRHSFPKVRPYLCLQFVNYSLIADLVFNCIATFFTAQDHRYWADSIETWLQHVNFAAPSNALQFSAASASTSVLVKPQPYLPFSVSASDNLAATPCSAYQTRYHNSNSAVNSYYYAPIYMYYCLECHSLPRLDSVEACIAHSVIHADVKKKCQLCKSFYGKLSLHMINFHSPWVDFLKNRVGSIKCPFCGEIKTSRELYSHVADSHKF